MVVVYNVKTGKTWSWTFANEAAAREAIAKGHSHDTFHLIVSSYGGEREVLPFELSMEISSLFIDEDAALWILCALKYDGKLDKKLEKKDSATIHKLKKYGLVTTSPLKITERGEVVITRLVVKSQMVEDYLKVE